MYRRVSLQAVNEGRKDYQDFLFGRSSHFFTHLFNTIAFANRTNIKKLAIIFPGHVFAYEEHMQTGRLKIQIETDQGGNIKIKLVLARI